MFPPKINILIILIALLSLVATGCERVLYSKLKQAEMLVHQRQFTQALTLYGEVALKDRNGKLFSKAMHESGDIYAYFLSDNERALKAYIQLLRYSSDNNEQLYALGQIAWIYHHRLKDYQRAIISYSKILRRFGDRKDVELHRIDIGDCYKEFGDFSQAIAEYRQFLDSLPTRAKKGDLAARAYYEIGNCYYFMDQLPEAMENYRIVSLNYPDTPYAISARFWEAICLENMEHYEKALAIYKEIEPTYPNPEVIQNKINRNQEILKIPKQ